MPTPDTSTRRGLTDAFRTVAVVEAITYLALLTAVFVYRVLDGPDLVSFLGPVHGIAFLVYLVLVLKIRESQAWGFWRTIVVILAAAVPLGGFWAKADLKD